jgi:hypothetical protein
MPKHHALLPLPGPDLVRLGVVREDDLDDLRLQRFLAHRRDLVDQQIDEPWPYDAGTDRYARGLVAWLDSLP